MPGFQFSQDKTKTSGAVSASSPAWLGEVELKRCPGEQRWAGEAPRVCARPERVQWWRPRGTGVSQAGCRSVPVFLVCGGPDARAADFVL